MAWCGVPRVAWCVARGVVCIVLVCDADGVWCGVVWCGVMDAVWRVTCGVGCLVCGDAWCGVHELRII